MSEVFKRLEKGDSSETKGNNTSIHATPSYVVDSPKTEQRLA